METQITLRLPADLARRLDRQARTRGTRKSQLVREAVSRYLDQEEGETIEQQWARVQRFVGSIRGKPRRAGRLADEMYDNNVRDA
jgi:predicted DNA-binding protein